MEENRYKYNKEILKELEQYLKDNQEMRFIQALWNLNIINWDIHDKEKVEDRFYEEPSKTLEKMKFRY